VNACALDARADRARSLPFGVVDETPNFADRLAEAVARKRSQLVVGLDPRLDVLPVELRGEAVLGRAAAASACAPLAGDRPSAGAHAGEE
jgi:hypothetical protein